MLRSSLSDDVGGCRSFLWRWLKHNHDIWRLVAFSMLTVGHRVGRHWQYECRGTKADPDGTVRVAQRLRSSQAGCMFELSLTGKRVFRNKCVPVKDILALSRGGGKSEYDI